MSTTYDVLGMTCGHCVAAVTRELAALPAVGDVHVDLAGARAVVSGAIVDEAVIAAIADAGYVARRRP